MSTSQKKPCNNNHQFLTVSQDLTDLISVSVWLRCLALPLIFFFLIRHLTDCLFSLLVEVVVQWYRWPAESP